MEDVYILGMPNCVGVTVSSYQKGTVKKVLCLRFLVVIFFIVSCQNKLRGYERHVCKLMCTSAISFIYIYVESY